MYNQTAQTLAQQGRYGDNMLVHMNPQEVAGLAALARAHGGHISINPKTGLPEAWGIGSIFGSKGVLGQAAKAVGLGDAYASASKAVSNVGRAITPFASMILPFIPGLGLPLSSLLSGLAGGVTKNGFEWKRGLLSGALSYGLGSLTAPSTTGATSLTSPAPIDLAVDSAGITNLPAATASNVQIPSITPSGTVVSSGIPLDTAPVGAPLTMTSDTMTLPPVSAPSAPVTAPAAPSAALTPSEINASIPGASYVQTAPVSSVENIIAAAPKAAPDTLMSTAGNIMDLAYQTGKSLIPNMKDWKDYAQLASAGVTAYGGYKSYQEQKAAKEAAAKILADRQAHTQQQIDWANQVMSMYPSRFERLTAEDVEKYGIGTQRRMAAGGYARSFDDELGSDDEVQMYGGGLGTLQNGLRFARGGMPPRFLQGQGDGMSDSIPARIAGRQEARLADGEFVIPADVVSHIGNGSSKAGAKKLYGMMDRVRKARTGKTRQAPAINAGGLMPA